ncbi:MAG: hypothetical protein ACM3SS_09995 [Rhodospirillaceae bacterium]
MRIKLGYETQPQSRRSYLDAADDIIGLPVSELMRITRTDRRAAWPEDCPEERVPDFLYRIYGLASQI